MSGPSRPRPLLKPPAPAASARAVTFFLAAALAALVLALLLAALGEAGLRRDLARLRAAGALRDDLAASRLALEGLALEGSSEGLGLERLTLEGLAPAGAAPAGAVPAGAPPAGGISPGSAPTPPRPTPGEPSVWPPLERALRRAASLAAGEPAGSEAGRLHAGLQRFSEATLALQADREAGLLHSPAAQAYDSAYRELTQGSATLAAATARGMRERRRAYLAGTGASAAFATLALAAALLSFRRFAAERGRAEAELRDRDAQLIQAQKMEAVGRLAGGIAHDINNYLGAIRLNCDLVAKSPLTREETVERMRGAIAALRRASTLISRLLAFSRRQPAQPEVVALNRVVEGLRKILRQHLGERIELETQLAPDLWAIEIDPAQVEQILVNLLVNAREAMPSGGRLRVETANASFPAAAPGGERRPVSAPGDYVLLTVADTGVGMPPEVLDKIFEPFFTTKEAGSGLGLATVYGLVKQNGGNVWAESAPKAGTTFRIYLPRCFAPLPEAALRETVIPPLALAGPEHVLLVEDGEEMRDATRVLLTSAGYRVTAVAGGAEALDALDSAPPVDLLLTDVVMRGLSGPEVAEKVQALCGPLPVIFVSGYTESAVGLQGLSLAHSHFLAKPYAADALLQKVREALAAGGDPAA